MEKKVFIIFCMALINVVQLSAQTQFSLDALIGKDWQATSYSEKKPFGPYFTETQHCYYFLTKDGRQEFVIGDFYLSDVKETSFDSTKVGKVKEGKYIIVLKNKKDGTTRIDIYSIVKLTDTEMKLIYHAKDRDNELTFVKR